MKGGDAIAESTRTETHPSSDLDGGGGLIDVVDLVQLVGLQQQSTIVYAEEVAWRVPRSDDTDFQAVLFGSLENGNDGFIVSRAEDLTRLAGIRRRPVKDGRHGGMGW